MGNVAGSLHIFKGSKSQKVWRTCSGLGMVSGQAASCVSVLSLKQTRTHIHACTCTHTYTHTRGCITHTTHTHTDTTTITSTDNVCFSQITSVACGDLTNSKKVAICCYFSTLHHPITMCPCPVQNVVLCVNAKGECFVFDVADQVGEVVRATVVAVGGVVCVLVN